MTEVNHTVAPAAQNQAPATAPAPKAVNGAKAPAKAKAASKKPAAKAAPVAPAKRASRIAGFQPAVLTMLSKATDKNGLSVLAMAQKIGCTEREVRLAIDRARNMGFKGSLLRTIKNHFALTAAGKTAAGKVAAAPKAAKA